ncbi:ABC transporter ATP-binding protein [Pontibacter sp. H249]|uniref:ABC transporter ATP-binding protein n=1 Tax=Pontibacter sp. H249 TaxID=3133420 RepID=UPI0030C506A7
MIGKNIIFTTIIKVAALLPKELKRKSFGMMALLLFNSFLDIVGLAAILPVIMILLQDEVVENSRAFNWVFNFFGFTSETIFLVVLALSILAFIVAKNITSLWIFKKQASFSYNLYRRFSAQLFTIYQNKGLLFFKKNNPNYITRNINSVPLEFTSGIILNTFTLINEAIIILVILTTILIYDPFVVAMLLIFILPVFSLFYKAVKNRSQAIQTELNEIAPMQGMNLFQSVYGYVDVKMNNSEAYFLENHKKLLNRSSQLRVLSSVLQHAPTKVIETGMMAAIILVALYGVLYVQDKSHITGLLSVFALAAYRILPSINRCMIALIGIKGYQYTFSVLDDVKQHKKQADKKATEKVNFNLHIRLAKVSFSYQDGHRVLDDIDLTIRKNSTIGLIGKSGSGKSTLVSLLLGFYKPTAGEIWIDDTQLKGSNIVNWRSKIGYVQQEVYILDASLAENIAFGIPKENIDAVNLERAIDLASLTDVVAQLPNGVTTKIGDRGSLLSGGQRQRVGIARALYQGASILIMDEATSALDSATENEINEAVARLADNDMTIIIIAHRLTTLHRCDSIIELESGRIKKEWAYEDLVGLA